MKEKEELIRERRTILAVQENLMGAPGKLGTIVKYLGQPIESEDGAYFQEFPMSDPWSLEDSNTIYDPTKINDWDDSTRATSIGWIFDGLSRGMHIEIKYVEFKSELTVTYKGYLVYSEISGHLEAYAPFPEWENMINQLFATANEIKKKSQKEEILNLKKESHREAEGFLTKLRMRWGI